VHVLQHTDGIMASWGVEKKGTAGRGREGSSWALPEEKIWDELMRLGAMANEEPEEAGRSRAGLCARIGRPCFEDAVGNRVRGVRV